MKLTDGHKFKDKINVFFICDNIWFGQILLAMSYIWLGLTPTNPFISLKLASLPIFKWNLTHFYKNLRNTHFTYSILLVFHLLVKNILGSTERHLLNPEGLHN